MRCIVACCSYLCFVRAQLFQQECFVFFQSWSFYCLVHEMRWERTDVDIHYQSGIKLKDICFMTEKGIHVSIGEMWINYLFIYLYKKNICILLFALLFFECLLHRSQTGCWPKSLEACSTLNPVSSLSGD